jgi:hypothetical protein
MYSTYAPRNRFAGNAASGTRTSYPSRTASSAAATPAQLSFLGTLLADVEALDGAKATDLRDLVNAPGFSKAAASACIDLVKATVLPDLRRQARAAALVTDGATMTPLAPGMYQTPAGDLVKVQAARGTGNLYGKTLVSTDGGETYAFTYTPGATRGLTQDHRLSLDAAKAWGKRTGTCCNCGALLTDPVSVDAGIGPICAGRI